MAHSTGRSSPKAHLRRSGRPSEQAQYLLADARAVVRDRPSRWIGLAFNDGFMTIAWYRLNRAGYLAFGRGWSVMRRMACPLDPLIRLFVGAELDYRASIGPGLRILHAQLGVVIGGGVTAGRGLILAGGNAIGDGNPTLGDHVQLGVNAVVLGDVTIGDGVRLGAGAVAIYDFDGPGLLVAPAAQQRPHDGSVDGYGRTDQGNAALRPG